jgi:hypothetical protein
VAGPVSPAAREAAASLREKSWSRRSYEEFQRSRAKQLNTASRRRLQSTAVDFQRLWWDKDARSPSKTGLSLWRPRPPPGYISLGQHTVMWRGEEVLLGVKKSSVPCKSTLIKLLPSASHVLSMVAAVSLFVNTQPDMDLQGASTRYFLGTKLCCPCRRLSANWL